MPTQAKYSSVTLCLSSLTNLTMLPRRARRENLDPIVPRNFPNSFRALHEESICLSSTDSEGNSTRPALFDANPKTHCSGLVAHTGQDKESSAVPRPSDIACI